MKMCLAISGLVIGLLSNASEVAGSIRDTDALLASAKIIRRNNYIENV